MSADIQAISAQPEAGPSRPRSPRHMTQLDIGTTPRKVSASHIEGYDDLLIGLGSDDMNDFGLDDEDTLSPPRGGASKRSRGVDVFDGQSLFIRLLGIR